MRRSLCFVFFDVFLLRNLLLWVLDKLVLGFSGYVLTCFEPLIDVGVQKGGQVMGL